MNLQLLRIFKAVADEGSVTRAAERLHCVQSNVSTRLTELEQSLNVMLFRRVRRRLVITPKGSELLTYAERMLKLAEEATLAMKGTGEPSGKLKIGSTEDIAALRLPPILTDFHFRYPSVDLTLTTANNDVIVDNVLDYTLDAAFAVGPVQNADLAQIEVFEEELVLITDRRQELVTSADDIAGKTILVPSSGCAYQARLEKWFAEAGITPKRIMSLGPSETIVNCVSAGMGIALVPRASVIQREGAEIVRCHELPAQYSLIKVMLVWRKDIVKHAARQAFTACVSMSNQGAAMAPLMAKDMRPLQRVYHLS